MPLVFSVATTEYISAVNRAPVSLSEPNESRLPMTGPLSALSAALLSMGTWGLSTKTLSPLRWLSSELRKEVTRLNREVARLGKRLAREEQASEKHKETIRQQFGRDIQLRATLRRLRDQSDRVRSLSDEVFWLRIALESIVAFRCSTGPGVARGPRLSLAAFVIGLRLAGSMPASESSFSSRVTSTCNARAFFAVRRTSFVSSRAAPSLPRNPRRGSPCAEASACRIALPVPNCYMWWC